MEEKIKPKMKCWVELIDPNDGRVVKRIPMECGIYKTKTK
jgi:hypothetical protein